MIERIEDAILRVFESANVSDANLEAANVVDVIHQLACEISKIAHAIDHKPHAIPYRHRDGAVVGCLLEAVIFVGEGLHAIADSISNKEI